MKNSDPERPPNVVALGPITPPTTPSWATPASFVPTALRKGLSRIPFENELTIWSGAEREALEKLITDPLMKPVYEFLEGFAPSEDSFRAIILDALVSSYHDIKSGENEYRGADLDRQVQFFSEVSLKVYELFELLNNGEWPTPDTDLHEFLGNSGIMPKLMELMSASTSSTWPRLYADYLNNPCASYSDWEGVEQKRLEEVLWSDEHCTEIREDYRFPPPDIRSEYIPGSEARVWPWNRFLSLSLERLDKISEKYRRAFVVEKRGNRQAPSSERYFFLESTHWSLILATLFGGKDNPKDAYKSQTINKIIRGHRQASERYI